MNLYKLHANPKDLDLHDEAHEKAPHVFWDKYWDKPAELKKREAAIAKDAFYSYKYAKYVLKGPFPAGEPAIAKSAKYSYMYAKHVVNGPFPAGEAAIAKDGYYSQMYAYIILKAPFRAGEATIAEDGYYSYWYARHVLNGPFPAGEAAIAKDSDLWRDYKTKILKENSLQTHTAVV